MKGHDVCLRQDPLKDALLEVMLKDFKIYTFYFIAYCVFFQKVISFNFRITLQNKYAAITIHIYYAKSFRD